MILDYLKEHTSSIHQEVEQENLAKYIIDHTISKADYQRLLIQNYHFYHTIETALLNKRELIDTKLHPFLTTQKSQSLKNDLAYLEYDIDRKSKPPYSLPIDTENAALGALYVSEGSALGGLMISKHLRKCPALSFIQQYHFFGANIPLITGRWKEFRQAVASYSHTPRDQEEVLQAAISTFHFFGQIMRGQV